MVIMKTNNIASLMLEQGIPFINSETRETYFECPDYFYYMSYGSNLAMERFLCYIRGGQPEGATRTYFGCRDKTEPEESVGLVFEGKLYYAGSSKQWGGGGVLFTDFDDSELSLGRMHLITKEQFNDVVSQECGGEAGNKNIDFEKLLTVGGMKEAGLYGHVVYVGTYNHIPVISFTTSYTFFEVYAGYSPLMLNSPSHAYANVIARGLVETFGLNETQVDQYFDETSGF